RLAQRRHRVDREEAQLGTNVIGNGDFQRLIFGFTIVAQMVLLCHSNVLALITDPVDHWCKPPSDYAGMSAAQWKNVGIPADEAGRFSQCRVYVRPGGAPNDTETKPCDSWDYDPVEARRSARSYWDLVCQRSWLLPLGNGVFMSGALIVVPFMGYLADTEGRKPVIVISSFVLMMSAIGSCFAEAYSAYLALIFVNSACASTVHIVTIILLFEVSPVQYRTFYAGLGSSVGVVFVELLFIVLTAVHIGWFPLLLLVVAPTLLLLSVTFTVYESPMWLLTMSRLKEAEEVIYVAAKANGMPRTRTKQAFDRIKLEMKKAIVPYAPVAPTALLLPGSLRGRAAAVFITTFIVMLAYYSLTWSRRLGGGSNLVVRVIYVAALVPTYGAMYVTLNVLGRLQLMLLLFALLGGVSGLYGIATYAEPGRSRTRSPLRPSWWRAQQSPPTTCTWPSCSRRQCAARSSADVGREDFGFAILSMVVFGGLVALLSLPETTVAGAADVSVTSIDGNRRDLLDMMQNTLMSKRKKRRMRRRLASISPTADAGAGLPRLSSPR
ncbi:hypothetical protein MTO96_030885, partial [Rhipicephalus appendiculatus]